MLPSDPQSAGPHSAGEGARLLADLASPRVARRAAIGSIGLLALALGVREAGAGPGSRSIGGTLPDPTRWPAWTPTPDAIRARLARLRKQAVSVRQFGARCDGITDDSAAFARAIAAGPRALLVDGPMRLSRPTTASRPLAVFGGGAGPHMIWDGTDRDGAILFQPDGPDPSLFARDLVLSGLHIVSADGQKPGGALVRATNVRGMVVADCRADRVSLATIGHLRAKTYDRTKGSDTVDPAVLAGFSATDTDDLNEDIAIIGNTVDFGAYMGDVVRFNFARRVLVHGNNGRFARISWWGGGAKRQEGGMPQFLRRVRDAWIAENEICNVNGGIYGNNGQSIAVVRNTVWDTTDVSIDFEGCIDCIAANNTCRNAGNFVFSTFYVARNVRFENNHGEQNGTMADIATRLGAQPIGNPRGIYLTALRGAGFVGMRDAIDVTFANNTLVYSGTSGLGRCLPAYFNRLSFIGNTLRNVAMDLRDRGGQTLVMTRNTLTFDRSARNPVTLLAGSAPNGRVTANVIRIDSNQPEGSVALGYAAPVTASDVIVADNVVSGDRRLPMVVSTMRTDAPVSLARNNGAPLMAGGEVVTLGSPATVTVPPIPAFAE